MRALPLTAHVGSMPLFAMRFRWRSVQPFARLRWFVPGGPQVNLKRRFSKNPKTKES